MSSFLLIPYFIFRNLLDSDVIGHDEIDAGTKEGKLDDEGIEKGGNFSNGLGEVFTNIIIRWIRRIESRHIEFARVILNWTRIKMYFCVWIRKKIFSQIEVD